jgi:4-hydroxybenzoate polyprenyltransferase
MHVDKQRPQQSPPKPHYQLVNGLVVDVNQTAPKARESTLLLALRLMRFDRPVGFLLLLWPTLAALFLAAKGMPSVKLLLVFTLGVVLTRAAGCVINDYADRWLDTQVERTRDRVLASGALSAKFALLLFAALMLIAFGLVCLTNATTIGLSVIALLIACAYPYCKRFTYYPQAVLGLAFSMGIPMAFSAHDQIPNAAGWLLFCGNFLWTLAYDTLYAMVDRDDDLQAGAKSTAILFGELDIAAVGTLHAMAAICFGLAGLRAELAWPFYVGVLTFVICVGWQIQLALQRTRNAYFQAFGLNQYAGLALFLGLLIALSFTSSPNI